MFSDTHFHLQHTSDRGADISSVLASMAANGCMFALDIGTRCDDLSPRAVCASGAVEAIADSVLKEKARRMLFFSAGIWPSAEAIQDRAGRLSELEEAVGKALSGDGVPLFGPGKLIALGECGLDHHWNPSGPDERSRGDFAPSAMATGEAELFEGQLEFARRFSLPVVVHSRDAYDGTLSCIRNVGYDRGIIHCYSYGLQEARSFLDRGWFISFSGSVTYTKRSRMAGMEELLRFVPRDRILVETDAPYLAPVPHRGKVNTPLLVEHVYRFMADVLNISAEQFSACVDGNIRALFRV